MKVERKRLQFAMRGSRGTSVHPAALTASVQEPQSVKPPRTNRLSRSFRLSQAALAPAPAAADSPRIQRPEFKTPTRVPRSRPAAASSEESPHNDSDFQQDIIWDATSPSPRRLGKRGRKHTAGAVNISDIVSRIAPKHGRPRVAEPTLQQWIGDSATIPCTPDVQAPRAKKKSPRPNGVDDLLRLAKQFDLNLFHQDDEDDEQQQSLELLLEDPSDFATGVQSEFPLSLPGSRRAAGSTVVETLIQPDLDRQLEDDLDFLFDGPTQQLSGGLSQGTPAQAALLQPAVVSAPTDICGKPTRSRRGPTSGSCDAFEDDWENDDLLNDSLVLEMTQNPQRFISPRLCSTQKAASQGSWREPLSTPGRVAPSAGSGVQKENLKPRATFKLGPNSDLCERSIQTDSSKRCQEAPRPAAGPESSCAGESGPQTTKPEQLRRQSDLRTPAGISQSASEPAQNFPERPGSVPSCRDLPAVDFLDDDLESFFSSDPVWDDPADDDLLCEMCEDLENRIQSGNDVSTVQASNQRAALQPTHRTCNSWIQAPAAVLPGRGAGGSLAAGVCGVKSSQQPHRFTQTKPASGAGLGSLRGRGSQLTVAALPRQHTQTKHFTFKKPGIPASTATSKGVPDEVTSCPAAVGKCSAAEIELKKQQALERRRRRLELEAAQNLRAELT